MLVAIFCWIIEASEGGGGGWTSNKAPFFIFWRSFLIPWRKGRHVGGEGGGHGVGVWVVREWRGAVGGRGVKGVDGR